MKPVRSSHKVFNSIQEQNYAYSAAISHVAKIINEFVHFSKSHFLDNLLSLTMYFAIILDIVNKIKCAQNFGANLLKLS